jgi:hypothetical protein
MRRECVVDLNLLILWICRDYLSEYKVTCLRIGFDRYVFVRVPWVLLILPCLCSDRCRLVHSIFFGRSLIYYLCD